MPPRETPPGREIVAERDFCCGGKRCPAVRVYSDGFVHVTDMAAAPGAVIQFDPDQARALLALLLHSIH